MSRHGKSSRFSNDQQMSSSKNLLANLLTSIVVGVILLNGFLLSYVWVTQEYLGKDTSNAVLGTNYDPVGFSLPEVSKPAKSFGKNLITECPKLSQAGAPCPHHWFGDFYANYIVVQTTKPWNYGENPNFPASNLTTKFLTVFPYELALIFYLLLLACAMVFPLWYATNGLSINLRVLVTLVIGLFSYPALFTLDRANTQGFVPLFVFGYALLNIMGTKSSSLLKNTSALLFAWKIHTWPLLFLSNKSNYKENLKVFFRAFIISCICLIPWLGQIKNSILGLGTTLFGMTTSTADLNIGIWRNQSASGLVYTLYENMFGSSALLNWRLSITVGLAYLILAVYLVHKRDYPMWINIFLLSSIMQMSVPRGYGYGSSYVIAVIAVLAYESLSGDALRSTKALEIFHGRFRKYFLIIALSLMLSIDFSITPSLPNNLVTAKNYIQPLCVIAIVTCIFSTHRKSRGHSTLKSS